MSLSIENARVLHADGTVEPDSVAIEDGVIAGIGAAGKARRCIDASRLLLLPGIVDVHGDAFERQIMPRPGVRIGLEIALVDTDRQMSANGITTAFHGVTCSWEPGLRSLQTCRDFLSALDGLKPRLACDTRMHLRFETYNLDAVDEARDWIDSGKVGILAFNDHTPAIHGKRLDPLRASQILERSGLAHGSFIELVESVHERGDAVPGALESLAATARARKVPMMSHDDEDGAMRHYYAALGCRISEFPKSMSAAETARDLGNDIVMGAPNALRGGSHLGGVCATTLVKAGLCGVLASDYYYPAQLAAAFRLASDGVLGFADSWKLVSTNPARAVGLEDRGEIATGKRADLVLVDDSAPDHPQVVATLVAGQVAHMRNGLALT
jgi:alpha-D-ribose 1-methylphosphonate 5-triphosphate diphosphatase